MIDKKCYKCGRVYDSEYEYCPKCGRHLNKNGETTVEIYDNGTIQSVKLNGEDVSCRCCGIKVQVLPGKPPKVTLDFAPDKLKIVAHGEKAVIIKRITDPSLKGGDREWTEA